jgi:hypothetical protein
VSFRCVRGSGLVSVLFLIFSSSYHDGQPKERSDTLRTYVITYVLTETAQAHTHIHT